MKSVINGETTLFIGGHLEVKQGTPTPTATFTASPTPSPTRTPTVTPTATVPSILSVTLSLWTDGDLASNDSTISAYRLKVPFSESQATWNNAASGAPWQSPGAAGADDRESAAIGSMQVAHFGVELEKIWYKQVYETPKDDKNPLESAGGCFWVILEKIRS